MQFMKGNPVGFRNLIVLKMKSIEDNLESVEINNATFQWDHIRLPCCPSELISLFESRGWA